MSHFVNGRLGLSPNLHALLLVVAELNHVIERATKDQSHSSRQRPLDELVKESPILKKAALVRLLNKLPAQLMLVLQNASLENGAAGLNAVLLAAVEKCHEKDHATVPKEFQNLNVKTN